MEPIAIIGIGCRFPKAKDPESFWQLLRDGGDAITQVPQERWNIDAFYDPEPGTPGKMSTRWGGFLEQVDQFDPAFFGISPREAERIDPQQRLVLEVAWEALENAGIAPNKLAGSQTGVFMGVGNYDYCRLLAKDINLVNAYDGTGNTLSITANRLSYILNLRGPSVLIETACSSSLVALHFACRSLQSGESNLCLVGGASLMLSPEPFITYSHARMMAADGRCKTFDASADGYVRGEGCGVVVIKRLYDALREEDNILAVIKGTAVNQDGLSNGLTAPNSLSQQEVIRQALKNAEVTPAQISYVEAHGTGTSLGDPIEVKSLKAVLMKEREADQPCWLGSVKTNIGHLEAASGMAGLIKVVLSLKHKEIPPHLHLKQLNSLISLEGTTFAIPTECQPWLAGAESCLAGLSAFGFGGTNCHVVLEEAPSQEVGKIPELNSTLGQNSIKSDRPLHLLSLSAKNEQALKELAKRYTDFLVAHPEKSLADVCFTANTGRSHFDYRLAVVAESTKPMQGVLEAFTAGRETTGLISGRVQPKKYRKVAFLFTGQGSQYVGMGQQLYDTQPIFRQTLERCDEILRPYLKQPLLSVIYPESGVSSLLNETGYTQPALFALEYALFQLWKSLGIEPSVVMGHSVGEYVAACVAGVFSLEDGLKLMAERGRLMQALPQNGEMVAVLARETQVAKAIQPYTQDISIAAINGPQSIVISGRREAVRAAIAALNTKGIKTKRLTVSHAFHSPLMEPMLATFEKVAASVSYSLPKIKLISNLTGELATTEVTNPQYWCHHVRQPVKFAASMETLYQQGYEMFLEIGARPTLLGMGRYCLPENLGIFLPSLSPTQEDWQQLLQSLAALYVRGLPVDWSAFDQDYSRRRLQLPTYPFQRQRYWANISEDSPQKSLSKDNPLTNLLLKGNTKQLAQHLETTGKLSKDELKLLPKLLQLLVHHNQEQLKVTSIEDWFCEIEWQLQPRRSTNHKQNGFHKPGSWLILADEGSVGQTIAKLLYQQGHTCILVYVGDAYQIKEDGTYIINPASPTDFERLFQEVVGNLNPPLQKVIHLWSLQAQVASELTISSLKQAQILGVGSTLHLLQALVKFNHFPRLWLVTRGATPVGSKLPGIAQAPLWGLGKVVSLEHPELWGGMLDLAFEATEDEVTKLLAEIQDYQDEDHLAFREGNRYVARLVKKPLPEVKEISFHSDGTYLITGGLGALGLKVACWMVERGVRQLVLTSRRGTVTPVQETLRQLEQAGAKVVVARADVSQEEDMVRIFEEIETSMLPLRGIVHAAGVPGYEAIKDMNFNSFESVLRPKVEGTWILHQLTKGMKLDFFVNFSSISSVWGSKGQAHYTAANCFLDLLAHYRQGLGLPALSVNWGPWQGGGMAVEEFQTWMTKLGMEVLQPEQALTALEYLLEAGCVQTTVANVDWTRFKSIYETRGKRLLLEQIEVGEATEQQDSKQQSEILEKLDAASVQDYYSILVAYLQSLVAKVLRLASSQLVSPQQGLFEMGMDSLMTVELVELVQSQLKLKLSMLEVLQAHNIDKLAKLLLQQLAPNISTPSATENELNLTHEAVLEDSITPENVDVELAQISSIFLTGATGFLGAFLLKELLEKTDAKLYCLVRATDPTSGLQKIYKNLYKYSLLEGQLSPRIIPVVGNLSQPRLGLGAEQFKELAEGIDVIYHNGAVLNFVYPYSALKPTNVLGTQEILRLACQSKVKPLHYVSTDAVFDSSAYYGKEVRESEAIFHAEGIDLGYTQSKWVAEKLVTIARDRGLPVSIYRPPLIAGDSKSGIWKTDDFTCRFIKGCIQMGSIPDMSCDVTLVPVDYVSQAIVHLSLKKGSLSRAFHLNNPNASSWDKVTDCINELGYPLRTLPYEKWEAELIAIVGAKENALSSLLPFFLRRWSQEKLTFAGLGQRRVKLNCKETIASLADSFINCPAVDYQLLNTYFSYFNRSSFLETPKQRI